MNTGTASAHWYGYFVGIVAVLGLATAASAVDVRPGAESLTEEQRDEIRNLEAIGYLPGTEVAPTSSGVTVHKQDRCHGGANLYVSGHGPEATLVDMDGQVLHTWRHEYHEVWPDRATPEQGYGHLNWRRAHLYENGDLLAVFEGVGLIKIDKDSKLLWIGKGEAHHDLKVLPNGDIWVLTREAHMIPALNSEKPILEDFITILDPQGQEKRSVSLLEAAEKSSYWGVVRGLMPQEGDIFHANTLERFDGSLERLSPLFKEGNVLTSFKTFNAIAIVEMNSGVMVWLKVGPWEGQHQPILLPTGNIVLFDNNRFCDYSRIVEFEPFTNNIVWYYMGAPPDTFFSKACGSCQPLPNGNLLVVESGHGRALELTRDKKTVWEFHNPHTVGDTKKRVAYLFDLVRLRPDFPLDWTQARRAKNVSEK